MTIETLRGLSRSYALGDLDRAAYVRKRHELLEAIVDGEIPAVPWRAPEPEAPTVFPDEEDEGDTTQEILPSTALGAGGASGGAGNRVLLVAGIAGTAIVAAALFAWFSLGPDENDDSEAAVHVAPLTPDVRFDPLTAFLAENSWTPERLEGLLLEWNHLDSEAREQARNGAAGRRFRQAALDHISTESALIELGDAEEALDTQEQLLDVIERLGMSDERTKRARADWIAMREQRLDAMTVAEAPEPAPEPAPAPDAGPALPAPATADPAITGETAAPAPEPQPATPDEPVEPVPVETTVAAEPQPEPAPAEPVAAAPEPEPAPASVQPPEPEPPPPPAGRTATSTVRTNCKPELARKRRPYCIDILDSGVKGPVVVVLPGGEFDMGGPNESEQPVHRVTLASTFGIGMFEVSVAELGQFCEATGTGCPAQPWSDRALPAVNVSWSFATAYTQWLSKITGARYRLPSEAEWEYAARAGTKTPYFSGDEIVPTDARYSFTTPETMPLAANDRSVNRNDFRLYHMHGNVREWVADAWHGNHSGAPADGSARTGAGGKRVVRGGSYADAADALRSAARLSLAESSGDAYTGFRVVRVIE